MDFEIWEFLFTAIGGAVAYFAGRWAPKTATPAQIQEWANFAVGFARGAQDPKGVAFVIVEHLADVAKVKLTPRLRLKINQLLADALGHDGPSASDNYTTMEKPNDPEL